jgi:hypothetical protein
MGGTKTMRKQIGPPWPGENKRKQGGPSFYSVHSSYKRTVYEYKETLRLKWTTKNLTES